MARPATPADITQGNWGMDAFSRVYRSGRVPSGSFRTDASGASVSEDSPSSDGDDGRRDPLRSRLRGRLP